MALAAQSPRPSGRCCPSFGAAWPRSGVARRFVVLPSDPRVRRLVGEINEATFQDRIRPVIELSAVLQAEFPGRIQPDK
jgi:hypothetical protein